MLEDDLEKLFDIFYREAPYDYVLTVEKRKRKYFHGSCVYDTKECFVYGPDTYTDALFTVLHELAHARIQHHTHSAMWEQELVRLLTKYNFPRDLAGHNTIIGPYLREYMNASNR